MTTERPPDRETSTSDLPPLAALNCSSTEQREYIETQHDLRICDLRRPRRRIGKQ